MYKLLMFPFVILLTSCGGIPAYKLPSNVPTANITLERNKSFKQVSLLAFERADDCSGRRIVGEIDEKEEQQVLHAKLPAGEILSFAISGLIAYTVGGWTYCDDYITAQFTPNENYEILFENNMGKCRWAIFRDVNGELVKFDVSVREKIKTVWNDESAFCKSN